MSRAHRDEALFLQNGKLAPLRRRIGAGAEAGVVMVDTAAPQLHAFSVQAHASLRVEFQRTDAKFLHMTVDFPSVLLHGQKRRVKKGLFRIPQPDVFKLQPHPFLRLLSGARHHTDFLFTDKMPRKILFRLLAAVLAQGIPYRRSHRIDSGPYRDFRITRLPARHAEGDPKARPPGFGAASCCIRFNSLHRFRHDADGPGMKK